MSTNIAQCKTKDGRQKKTSELVDETSVNSGSIPDKKERQSEVENSTIPQDTSSHGTQKMERVTRAQEVTNSGHNLPKQLRDSRSTVRPNSNGRLSVLKKTNKKSRPTGKNKSRNDFSEKQTAPLKDDIKPQSALVQRQAKQSDASNVVAVTSISLISVVTFVTIMGVYFKKISFNRKRYGEHILLSTEEDDLPLFNRQTNCENY